MTADDVVFSYDADGVRVSRTHGDYATVFVAGLMEIDLDDGTAFEGQELIGYLASALVVASLAMTSVVRLRMFSLAGSVTPTPATSSA